MAPSNFAEWIAWGAVVVPLSAMAWSAWRYVDIKGREIAHAEYQRLFEVTEHLGSSGSSIVSKVLAAYELRKYPEYREVIIRVCEQANVEGEAADMLRRELDEIRKYYQKKS
jgi:hypothetical protein